MAGPVGHIENYMISLWLVTLVVPPLNAAALAIGLVVWAHPQRTLLFK